VFTIDCERYYPNVTRSIPREAVPREELSVRPDAPVYFFVTGRHLYSFDRNPLHVSSDHRLSSLMSDLNRRNVRSSDGIQEVKFRKDKETRKIMDDPDSEI
jgi:glycosylphosphatidylinositol transamidase (GPIT) subunit GPI8